MASQGDCEGGLVANVVHWGKSLTGRHVWTWRSKCAYQIELALDPWLVAETLGPQCHCHHSPVSPGLRTSFHMVPQFFHTRSLFYCSGITLANLEISGTHQVQELNAEPSKSDPCPGWEMEMGVLEGGRISVLAILRSILWPLLYSVWESLLPDKSAHVSLS